MAAPRKKLWHESKYLRKRAAFLLDDVDLIPTDVSFRVGKGQNAVLIHGHKIFYALVSPVFQVMLFGSLDEQKAIVIPDVTSEAFQCLKTYAYSDSFAPVCADNVMDVLAASKKYMMNKLTRYCYEFIQNKITAETAIAFWRKSQEISDGIVEKQSSSEIKRSAAKVVLSEEFLDLDEARLIDLTSWNDLNIREPDLYSAVKKWETHQAAVKRLAEPRKKRRKNDGILQHIRFGLFTSEELASGPVTDGVFTEEDLQEFFLHAFGAKQLTTFKPEIRSSHSTFTLSIKVFVSNNLVNFAARNMRWQLFDTLEVTVLTDVAPKACQLLREIVEGNHRLELSVSVGPLDSVAMGRKVTDCRNIELLDRDPELLPERAVDMEKRSELWVGGAAVSSRLTSEGCPQLALLAPNSVKLDGKESGSRLKSTSGYGVVVGKALKEPGKHWDMMMAYLNSALDDFGLQNEDKKRPWLGSQEFAFCQRFECQLVD